MENKGADDDDDEEAGMYSGLFSRLTGPILLLHVLKKF
jgi:hypothetical protein